MNTKRPGRPRLVDHRRLTAVVTARVTEREAQWLDDLATDAGVSASEALRDLIRAEHRRAQKRDHMRRRAQANEDGQS